MRNDGATAPAAHQAKLWSAPYVRHVPRCTWFTMQITAENCTDISPVCRFVAERSCRLGHAVVDTRSDSGRKCSRVLLTWKPAGQTKVRTVIQLRSDDFISLIAEEPVHVIGLPSLTSEGRTRPSSVVTLESAGQAHGKRVQTLRLHSC